MPEKRQLAAIMFTDIVGYTALMGKDENAAYQLLKRNRSVQKPLIEKHGGKWLKEMGDGVLASFQTISDAVYCAIEIQQICREDDNLKLRIGIHQGEVIVDEGDVFGEGVNIASRIEPLAPTGGIYISESVYRNIKNRQGIVSEFVREETLKNVDHPVRIYSVNAEASEVSTSVKETIQESSSVKKSGSNKKLVIGIVLVVVVIFAGFLLYHQIFNEIPPKESVTAEALEKSIAVMPFDNESSDEDNQYFVNGMMEDIRNNLAKIADLRVISKTSTEKYRGTKLTSQEIGNELLISYLLEGTVQKIGNQVKIHAQLISTKNDDHIWQDTYVRDISNIQEIFSVQSQIAETIAGELRIVVTPNERKLIGALPTSSTEAYDFYLKGRDNARRYKDQVKIEDYDVAIDFFDKAIKIDAQFANVYAHAADLIMERHNRSVDFFTEEYLDTVLYLCNKALLLDSNLADGYLQRARYFSFRGENQNALDDFSRVLELNPNNAYAAMFKAYLLENPTARLLSLKKAESLEMGEGKQEIYQLMALIYGQYAFYDKVEEYLFKSLEARKNTNAFGGLLWFNTVQGKFEQANQYARENYLISPDTYQANIGYAITFDYLGRFEEADPYWEIGMKLMHEENASLLNETQRYAYHLWHMGQKDKAITEFRRQEEYCLQMLEINRYGAAANYDLAGVYAFLGEKEKTYTYLETSEIMGGNLLADFMQVDPLFDSIRGEKRFKEIAQEARKNLKLAQAQILEVEKNY